MSKRKGRTLRIRTRRRKDSCQNSSVPGNQVQDNSSSIEFLKWMNRNGFKPSVNMCLRKFEGTGRGMMALQHIQPGSTIVSIPEKLLITPDYVLGTNFGFFLKRLDDRFSDLEVLTLFLIYEKLKGKDSHWYPYINTLPKQQQTPSSIKDEFFAALPPSIRQAHLKKINEIQSSYRKVLKVLHNLNSSELKENFQFDFRVYAWASFIVTSRAVYKPCEHLSCGNNLCDFDLALAPYLDFLNHSWKAKVLARFNTNTRSYEIVTQNKCKRYSEVLINYGSHSNRLLLIEYGFVEEGNTNDMIPVYLSDIQQVMEISHGEIIPPDIISFISEHLLQKVGITTDGLTWTLETALKIVCEKDKDNWKHIILNLSNSSDNLCFRRLYKELVQHKLREYDRIQELDESLCDICPQYLLSLHKLLSIERQILLKVLV